MTGLRCWVWVRGLGVPGLEARFGFIGFLFMKNVNITDLDGFIGCLGNVIGFIGLSGNVNITDTVGVYRPC